MQAARRMRQAQFGLHAIAAQQLTERLPKQVQALASGGRKPNGGGRIIAQRSCTITV